MDVGSLVAHSGHIFETECPHFALYETKAHHLSSTSLNLPPLKAFPRKPSSKIVFSVVRSPG